MSAIALSPFRAELLRVYSSLLDVPEPAEILPVSVPPIGSRPSFQTLVARLPVGIDDAPDLWFHGTLGDSEQELGARAGREHAFVGIYEIEAPALVQLLGECRHHDVAVEALDVDGTFPLSREAALRRRGYTHGLVLRADLYADVIPAFADATQLTVAGIPTRMLSVLPLTEDAWRLKVDGGVDALFEGWDAAGRDPFTVRPER
ncbi:MAG: hypothetical protein WCJ30_09000 [Deltaproteobacteria bacterium]